MSEFQVHDLVVNKSDKYLGDINQVIKYWDNKLKLKGHSFFHVYVADSFRLATPEEIKAGKRLP